LGHSSGIGNRERSHTGNAAAQYLTRPSFIPG
jgi:hypothetical protein